MIGIKIHKSQANIITIAVIIALFFGAYFLRHYISIIIFAAISAFIFSPIHKFFLRRNKKPGRAATQTFLISLFVILVPIGIVFSITILQIKHLLDVISSSPSIQTGQAAQDALTGINNILSHIPGTHPLTMDDVNEFINNFISKAANNLLSIITSSVGSVTRAITDLIIYIYLFVNILMHQDILLDTIKRLNPLGAELNQMYLNKMGSMTKAMALGQFVIAFTQGIESSLVLYAVGFHDLFFFFIILLSFLSLIPLGAGIVTIPIGIGLALTGNVLEGVLVIANHLLVVTNIDNVIRPKLVPKNASLNSALTILSVFAGVGMFGFLGIIIGPVIMIVIVSTIRVYLASNDPKYRAEL